jgi:hypothetical protein
LKVVDIYVYEQSMMVKNDYDIVHCIKKNSTIEPSPICIVIPWFMDFDQTIVDEVNTT